MEIIYILYLASCTCKDEVTIKMTIPLVTLKWIYTFESNLNALDVQFN